MPDFIDQIISNFNAGDFLRVILPVGLVCFALGLLIRLILGKKSNLNRAITACAAILVCYILVLIAHGYFPQLGKLVHSLPFITLEGTVVQLQSFEGLDLPGICQVLFPAVLLSFVVNLLESVLPKAKNVFAWLITRLLVVVASMAGYLLVLYLLQTLIPAQWLSWLPMILLGILALSFVLAALKLVLGLALAAVSPIIAGLYAFFFGQSVGKSMSRSLLTTLVLTVCVLVLEHFGYTRIDLAGIDPEVFAPCGLAILVIWYVICRIF